MSQNTLIAKAIKRRWLSPLQAWEKFGCLRLAARIFDLRREGMKIDSRIVVRGDKRFAQYRAKRKVAEFPRLKECKHG